MKYDSFHQLKVVPYMASALRGLEQFDDNSFIDIISDDVGKNPFYVGNEEYENLRLEFCKFLKSKNIVSDVDYILELLPDNTRMYKNPFKDVVKIILKKNDPMYQNKDLLEATLVSYYLCEKEDWIYCVYKSLKKRGAIKGYIPMGEYYTYHKYNDYSRFYIDEPVELQKSLNWKSNI